MDDAEAIELIDAHLDRQPLTDEQSDALTDWIKAAPRRADEAFYRIFLHSYLRSRLQAGLPPAQTDLARLDAAILNGAGQSDEYFLSAQDQPNFPRKRSFWRTNATILCGLVMIGLAAAGWWNYFGAAWMNNSELKLYASEEFDYPATILPKPEGKDEFKWPTTGGLQGLSGGTGWSEPWQETNSKVAIIVDYAQLEMPWQPTDMRKFGPLGYTDAEGNVLRSSGNLMRTATSPRSISTRELNLAAFPDSMRDEQGLGRDGTVLWLSFLAQSSVGTAESNRYSYLLIGSKEVAGLRIGKLGASPLGNWTAVGLQTGAEVNLRSSTVPSGETAFFVARVVFRPGPEDALVWINPSLKSEPAAATAPMHLPLPDFRFDAIAIHANHSTDFDEIRLGGNFRSVAPLK